jgi:multiple sugar transport system ATP-binding protein
VHERVALRIEPETCHLFDAEGRALPHLTRHPLAEMRPTAQQAQPR